jgi:hypothetical protein
MFRLKVLCATATRLAVAAATTAIHASGHRRTLVVTRSFVCRRRADARTERRQ